MDEKKTDICDSGEDVQQHLYVLVMRVPAMYWTGIVLYLDRVLGYSEWTASALNMTDQMIASYIENTRMPMTVVLPMTKRQKEEVQKFTEREIPGAVSIFTFDGYYKEKLGASFGEVYSKLYDDCGKEEL